MGPLRRIAAAALVTAVVAGSAVAVAGSPASASSPTPPPVPADAHWLTLVNYYRAMAGLGPVVENPAWSDGAYKHSCYMLLNGMSHDEVPGRPGYTPEGRAAGQNGNVAVTSVLDAPARRPIELWLTGPFHAIGLLRHNLTHTGFGQCRNPSTSPYKSAATLDVLRGLSSTKPRPSWPILFPGNGTTTNLDRFVAESPSPLTFCGWPSGGGLPVIAMMPEAFTSVSGSMTGPTGPLQTCVLHKGNTSGVASSILGGDHAAVVMPRNPLQPGTYQVTVTTNVRTVSWSFTVDPSVADGALTPVANTKVVGPTSGFVPLSPRRIVDTRTPIGAYPLAPNAPAPILVAGVSGIPKDATAISANFTVAGGASSGYLTVYPCGSSIPQVSTVNFARGEIVPNAAVVPLDGNGRMCAVSNTRVHLLVDVNGAFTPNAAGTFVATSPSRLFDTRSGHRAPLRPLRAGQTLSVDVKAPGTGVPANAQAVVVNLTAHRPSSLGFVTAWPCGEPRPTASNLNPRRGETRPNTAIVPIPSDGRICFLSDTSTDLFADLLGYLVEGVGQRFTPLAPIRLTDTRESRQSELNAGLGGNRLAGGTAVPIPIRGIRGVPSDAKAVSVNVTTVGAAGNGYVTVYPCTSSVPFASNVNLQPGKAVPNGAQARLSTGGSLCLYSSHDVHVVVDINGYWS